jgi:hypothetical protein
VSEDSARFHNEIRSLKHPYVVQWVFIESDDIGVETGRYLTKLTLDI